jgi:hypothetical protein
VASILIVPKTKSTIIQIKISLTPILLHLVVVQHHHPKVAVVIVVMKLKMIDLTVFIAVRLKDEKMSGESVSAAISVSADMDFSVRRALILYTLI